MGHQQWKQLSKEHRCCVSLCEQTGGEAGGKVFVWEKKVMLKMTQSSAARGSRGTRGSHCWVVSVGWPTGARVQLGASPGVAVGGGTQGRDAGPLAAPVSSVARGPVANAGQDSADTRGMGARVTCGTRAWCHSWDRNPCHLWDIGPVSHMGHGPCVTCGI